MPRILKFLAIVNLVFLIGGYNYANAQSDENKNSDAQAVVENLDQPLYTPFVERYVLDELKQLRTDMAAQRVELVKELTDRELAATDRSVIYATDTITYFFYLIAGVTSILVLVGWTSIRDVKEKVHGLAIEEVGKLINEYEQRLQTIEDQLNRKTESIEQNRQEIELVQEVQGLWMRAAQESAAANRIPIYDQILTLRDNDPRALTYKADAVLELEEAQWAISLCHQALVIEPENSNAHYQLACAHALLGEKEKAVEFLTKAISLAEHYREEIASDPALKSLLSYQPFQDLIAPLNA